MATSAPLPPLAERLDIHKSCKSFETLLSVFNDYCEAAGAVVTLQKKMAKALRETAGMKVTGEIAANTLGASATIFEALSEIDSKFAKLVDKEYDGLSSDVKKWFKKLAKEEKAHDERIAIANAKIKQAGQIYEKKSKKSARDASEEHARYINLISAMGPEISQEKYNHSLQVTQRHTTTIYNLAASVSRVADAEWLRSCENVRRFGPTIGKLSEWRAFCEGGWTGPIPQDLRDIDVLPPPSPVEPDPPMSRRPDYDDENEPQTLSAATGKETMTLNNIQPAADLAAEASQPTVESQEKQIQPFPSPTLTQAQIKYQSRQNQSAQPVPPSSFEPPRKFTDNDNTGSVRSLSQFPAPPTHFPLPPPLAQRQTSGSSSSGTPSTNLNNHWDLRRSLTMSRVNSTPSKPVSAEKPVLSHVDVQSKLVSSDDGSPEPKSSDPTQDKPSISPAASPTVSSSAHSLRSFPKGDYLADEHGVNSSKGSPKEEVTRANSNSSVVAAMRSRYSYTSGSASPPPKDIPRLPLSVNDLATRYQPQSDRDQSFPSLSAKANSPEEDDRRRHQQRLNQLAEMEIKGKERELRLREQEIELRSQELEREKAYLLSRNEANYTREPNGLESPRNPQPVLRPRERQLSFQQPTKVAAHRADNYATRPISQYSASTTHLVPPQSSSPYERGGSDDGSESGARARRDSSNTSSASISNHAPYCGCENCSAAKYKLTSSSPVASPLRSGVKDKPKGWMRRLSMPIVAGNPFLDSSKRNNSKDSSSGLMSLDSKKNGSTTGLGMGVRNNTVMEDGRFGAMSGRRSYDAGGISNRSMTNLGLKR
ncbi:hypothetical protein BT96DRAFT_919580 [Gymnopus androsaceus JB14]|uniref:IMD domain-containing protein n=1 Tax=Gymnopus androsaceus JB14 TaxID=1447944 RepID=A0A6A4HQZ4_9AGAR|nr:hypothetical protein BT96DRAFT_919580 [Gymnopus androsaceus JB14]